MPALAFEEQTATIDRYNRPAIYRQNDVSSDTGDWPLKIFSLPAVHVGRAGFNSLEFHRLDEILSLSDLVSTRYVEPSTSLAQAQRESALKHLKALEAAKERVSELKSQALEDGHIVSRASEKDLFAFLMSRVFAYRPFITLLDNGNLRALWKNAGTEQIGLQFLGNKQVQYVFFAKRLKDDFMARAAGRDALSEISRQIDVYNLGRLMTP